MRIGHALKDSQFEQAGEAYHIKLDCVRGGTTLFLFSVFSIINSGISSGKRNAQQKQRFQLCFQPQEEQEVQEVVQLQYELP